MTDAGLYQPYIIRYLRNEDYYLCCSMQSYGLFQKLERTFTGQNRTLYGQTRTLAEKIWKWW